MARKINLKTAKVSNGALPAKSVYEMVGIPTTSYKHKSLADYSKMIGRLNLIELQDHAYEQGVPAGPDRDTLIDRLERKFIQENARFAATFSQPDNEISAEAREAAERLLSRRS